MVRLSWTEDHGDQMVHGANMNLLSLDEAYVILKNGYYEDTFLLSAFKECIDVSKFAKSNLHALSKAGSFLQLNFLTSISNSEGLSFLEIKNSIFFQNVNKSQIPFFLITATQVFFKCTY